VSRTFGALATKVLCVDADQVPDALAGLDGYVWAHVLVRLGGEPVGVVRVPVEGDVCPGRSVLAAIDAELGSALARVRLLAALERQPSERALDPGALSASRPEAGGSPVSTVTVAVCTRDRADQLERCLAAIARQRLATRVLVVDNAPSDDATARLLAARFPDVERVVEPRPGLDHARNRAIATATTEVVAFTDDDVVVDPGWTWAIARAFDEEPDLGLLTGLVLPLELETPAQQLFERYGGFGRGVTRRWVAATGDAGSLLGTGELGTGANMAVRRTTIERIGAFDPALDVGTPTGGGGDLELFYRALAYGELVRYEPAAIVFHRHRATLDELAGQLRGNGATLAMMQAARERGLASSGDVGRVLGWYIGHSWPRRLAEAVLVPNRMPARLPLAEVSGMAATAARRTYRRSQRVNGSLAVPPVERATVRTDEIAVSTVDLAGPIEPPTDGGVGHMILVTHDGAALGRVEVAPTGHRLSARRLRELIVDHGGAASLVAAAPAAASVGTARSAPAAMPARRWTASIVIATLDRPDDLAACLDTVLASTTVHDVEVVVVDNNPASGLTAPVVASHPSVSLVDEPRRGLAHARNAGIRRAGGEIVVTTDDDVRVPPGWLDRLLEPFRRNDVLAVCGNVQPLELANRTQIEFERAGPLGKGFDRFESRWEHPRLMWRACPTWELGATANAAFRATAFSDPEIGLMDVALGPGTATGVGEDSYLLYRIVRAGYTVVYEPTAVVWHRHRDTPGALERQITGYYSGHVAHQLTTLLRDRDPRAVNRLARLGAYVVTARARSLLPAAPVPPDLARAQLRGAASGPLNYVRARRRAAREAS
jgi:GT2 family glycosyltransferase